MRYKHILFDLDGTLVDSFPGIESSALRAICHVLPGREFPNLRSHIGPPIREIFRRSLMIEDPAILNDLEKRFRTDYDIRGLYESVLYQGVKETLKYLSHVALKCSVVTNKPQSPTNKILRYLGVDSLFERIATPDFLGMQFTNKTLLTKFLLDQMPAQSPVLFVGDSEDDFDAAQACGCDFAAATYGYGQVVVHRNVIFTIQTITDLQHLL